MDHSSRSILALAVLVLASCTSLAEGENPYADGGGGPGGGGTPPDDAPAEVKRGAELYAQHCQSCHGPNASGSPVYPASIQGRTGILPTVRNGRGAMPPFAESQLGDGDVADIEDYLAWLAQPGNGGGGGNVNLPPYEAYCVACHGANGEGTSLGPTIRFPYEPYAAWVVRNGRDTMGYDGPMPAYGADQLGDEDLEEIFSFLQDQPMPTDGRGLYDAFCGNCHGADGSGGVVRESASEDAGSRNGFFEIVREGHDVRDYGARTGFMPPRNASELTDEQVELIRQYLLGS